MTQLRPLIYLSYRTWVNSIRRSLGSPRRTIGLLIFLALQLGILYRILGANGASTQMASWLDKPLKLDLPAQLIPIVFAIEFVGFAILLIFAFASISSVPVHFKKADVDVLFATPVSPRLLLGLSYFRGKGRYVRYAVIALVTRAGTAHGFGGRLDPSAVVSIQALTDVVLSLSLAMALFQTMTSSFTSYGQLWFARDDERMDLLRRRIGWGIAVFFLILPAVALYCIYTRQPFDHINAVIQSPILRTMLFPVTLTVWVAQGILTGYVGLFWTGIAAISVLTAAGILLALSRADWLFDAAARVVALGPDENNPTGGLNMADSNAFRHATGKVGKKHRLRMWARRHSVRGLWALPWRTFVMSPWGHLIMWSILFCIAVGIPFAAKMGVSMSGGWLNGLIQFPIWLLVSSARLGGVGQLLRRGDQMKPLPFFSGTLLFAEAAIQFVPYITVLTLANFINVAVQSYSWQIGLTAQLTVTSLLLLLQSIGALTSVLAPDLADSTQRGLKSVITIALLLIGNIPWIAVTAICGLLLHWRIPWIAIPGAIANFLAAWVCFVQAGRRYEFYNPTE